MNAHRFDLVPAGAVIRATAAIACLIVLGAATGLSQNFSGDARHVAMGSIGDQNMASRLAGESRSYRSIVLPLGLYQAFKTKDIFDPSSDRFNPLEALDYLSSPLHFGLNRPKSNLEGSLVTDLVTGLRGNSQAALVRDLIQRLKGPSGQSLIQDLVSGNREAAQALINDLLARHGTVGEALVRDLVSRFQGTNGQAAVADLINKQGDAGENLVLDLLNGQVSRNLNDYRGFIPTPNMSARGLMSPTLGKTIRVHGDKVLYHGVYFGVGPYISVGTEVNIDQKLIDILGSPTELNLANSTFTIGNTTSTQLAGSITGGYRAHIAVPGIPTAKTDRDGLYLAANYNYLHGIRYDTADVRVRFDTDSSGLITLHPTTIPVAAEHLTSAKGRGAAIDVATSLVMKQWDFTFGAKGIGNRMNWEGVKSETFQLSNIFDGLDFVTTPLVSRDETVRVTLPVRYSGGAAFNAEKWTIDTEISRGLQKMEFNGGGEYRLKFIEFRGGARYSRELWHPSAGLGINLTKGFGIDVAGYRSTTNIRRQPETSIAVSLRFNHSR